MTSRGDLSVVLAMTSNGVALPADTSAEQALAAWQLVAPELTGDLLTAAVRAYLRSGERWWPTAGQLLAAARPSTEGASDLLWSRIVGWRSEGRRPPEDPTVDGWMLGDTMGQEWCRLRIVLAIAGDRGVHMPGESRWAVARRALLGDSELAEAARSALAACMSYVTAWDGDRLTPEYERRETQASRAERRTMRVPTRDSDRAWTEARIYAATADAHSEVAALRALARRHETPPRQPVGHERWHLDRDREKAKRLWRAIAAAGGWDCLPTQRQEAEADDGARADIGARRAAFRRVLSGEGQRAQQREVAAGTADAVVARLVDMGAGGGYHGAMLEGGRRGL